MRITNGMIRQTTLAQIQDGLQGVAESQRKVSSGMRLQKPSDDPTAAAGSMRTRVSLRAVEQYRRSADLAKSRSVAEEDILLEITDVLSRAKVLGTSQGTSSATAATRSHTKAEVDQLFRQVLDLANTKFEGSYLFGGVSADVKPYTLDDANPVLDFVSTTPSGQHTVEIGEQRYMATNHNGFEVFEDTGVLSSLRELATALHTDDLTGIGASLASLDASFGRVQDVIGDIGARVNQLEVTRGGLDLVEVSLKEFKSTLEEIDFEEAATELASRQTALQAAMLATSRVMGMSLADYLR